MDRYSTSSTQWTLLCLNFAITNYWVKLIWDKLDATLLNLCFSNITITHSISQMDTLIFSNDFFESIPDYRKIVFLMFLIYKDRDLLSECGYFKKAIKGFV